MRMKLRLAKLLCHKIVGSLIAQAFGDRIPWNGLRVATNGKVQPETKAALFWRLYESAEYRLINKYLRRDLDVIELGASIGAISCCIRQLISPGARFVCVEANPELIPLVRDNLMRNCPSCPAVVLNLALVGTSASEVLLLQGSTTQTSKVVAADDKRSDLRYTVEGLSFSDLIRQTCFSDYALVCDIEGSEVELIFSDGCLVGCRQLIIELHTTLFHDRVWSEDDLVEELWLRHGMRLRDRYGSVCVLEPA